MVVALFGGEGRGGGRSAVIMEKGSGARVESRLFDTPMRDECITPEGSQVVVALLGSFIPERRAFGKTVHLSE